VTLAPAEFLWALESLARLHRLPFDASLLAQQFPPPYSPDTLVGAAASFGVRMSRVPLDGAIERRAFPCLAFVKPTEGSEPAPARPAILVDADAERLVYFEAGREAPRSVAPTQWESVFEPHAFLATRTVRTEDEAASTSGIERRRRPFGFRWFVPELLKHRAIWREVLIASLVLQLIGLATPLFTQVVIDKVVVHHTLNTLAVIGVALALFLVFNAAMTWARQYLVLHTGNRIDAVLAARVFKHLFSLPVPYFEHRPTGTLTARMQGIESIREFLTGAAVAVILDLPFTVIFLAGACQEFCV
jgi:subfamily B ATP-binding cassette protein HlyB/CyaB